MENEPDHENVEQSLCAKTTDEDLNKSFSLEASLSKFSYIDLDKELEFRNDLVIVYVSRSALSSKGANSHMWRFKLITD